MSVLRGSERQSMLPNPFRGQPHFLRCSTDVTSNSSRSVSAQDFAGNFLEGLTAPTDGYAQLTRGQEIVVILSVSDSNRVMNREAESCQRLTQAHALADRLGKHHQPATIEQQYKGQFQLADYGQDLRSGCRIEFHDGLPRFKFEAEPPEFLKEWQGVGTPDQP